VRGYLSEGRRWLRQALAAGRSSGSFAPTASVPERVSVVVTPVQQVRALIAAGRLAHWQADLDSARGLFEKAAALARDRGEPQLVAEALTWLGSTRRRQGAFEEARQLLLESLPMHEVHGDRHGAAWALCNIGAVEGNLFELRESGSAQHEEPLWQVPLEESLERFRAVGDPRFIAITGTLLGANIRSPNDRDRQASLLNEALAGFQAVGDRSGLLGCLLSLAEQAARFGPPASAARLLGAAEALRDALGATLAHVNRVSYEAALRGIVARLSEDELAAAMAEGHSMGLDEVLAEVRQSLPASTGATSQAGRPSPSGSGGTLGLTG
jgi:hypothetical protein